MELCIRREAVSIRAWPRHPVPKTGDGEAVEIGQAGRVAGGRFKREWKAAVVGRHEGNTDSSLPRGPAGPRDPGNSVIASAKLYVVPTGHASTSQLTRGLRPREEKRESGEEMVWAGARGEVGAKRWQSRPT